MLPGCRSACTKPSSKIIFSSVCRPEARHPLRVGAGRAASTGSSSPSMKLMVRMRSVDSSSISSGKTTSGWPRKLSRKRRLLRASMRKSSCANTARPNSSTVATGRQRRDRRDRRPACARRCASPPGRTCRARRRSGRRTLTATMRPSGRRALWTCDTDADASGTGANSAKSVAQRAARGPPRWCARRPRTGTGRRRSCSSASAREMCSGMRSGRVLMIWPTLMKVAPELAEQVERPPARTRPAAAPCPRAGASSPTHPTPEARASAWRTSSQMASARATRRQRGRDFAAIAGILYYRA